MSDTLTVADLTDRECRWLVNIFAALTGHIEDELAHEGIAHHVPDLQTDDPERFWQFYQYVEAELRQCMERLHPEEVACLDAVFAAYQERHPELNIID